MRGAIESMYIRERGSARSTAQRCMEMFDLKVSHQSVNIHMRKHADPEQTSMALSFVALLSEDDGGKPLTVTQAIVDVLLFQVVGKLVNGDIEIRNMSDAVKVMTLSETVRRNDHAILIEAKKAEQEMGASSQSIEDMYRQLGYIMEAFKATVPEEYLRAAVVEAWRRGLGKDLVDLTEVPIYQTSGDYTPIDMSLAVEDMNTLGRKRTRKELTEGIIECEDVPPDE